MRREPMKRRYGTLGVEDSGLEALGTRNGRAVHAVCASTAPTKPRVSINPNASFTLAPCWSSAVTYQEACTKAIDRTKKGVFC